MERRATTTEQGMRLPEQSEHQTLSAGSSALDGRLDDAQLVRMLAYRDLLLKWNVKHNLTAIRDPRQALTHHLLDSLAIVAPLRRMRDGARLARLLDVGSGGGLPGVLLAMAMPNLQVVCVDAASKKTGFIRQAAAELGLQNIRAVHSRVESLEEGVFDIVASRAFASLTDFSRLTRQHLAADGVWLAMKGLHPQDEIAALPEDVEVFHVEQLVVPGLDAERCIVWMRKRATAGAPRQPSA